MASNSASPAQIASIAGPLLVGYLLSWGLYGALSVQVYIYYLAFPRDRIHHKFLVYGVYVIETLQAILVAHDAFAAFVTGFGNFKALTDMHFAWLTMPILSGIVACIVQLFYAFRIMTLSKSRIIPAIIALLAVLQFTGALISGVQGVKAGNLTKLTSHIDHIGHGLFDITSAICDVVIATCMAFYLSRMNTGIIQSTHAAVSRITRLIVGTGALTATIAVIDVALYFGGHHEGFFLTPAVILGRLYSNSMMVIFNSRIDIVGGRGGSESTDIVLSGLSGSSRQEQVDNGGRINWDYLPNTFPEPKWEGGQTVKTKLPSRLPINTPDKAFMV